MYIRKSLKSDMLAGLALSDSHIHALNQMHMVKLTELLQGKISEPLGSDCIERVLCKGITSRQ